MMRGNLSTKAKAVGLIALWVFTVCSPRPALAGQLCFTGPAASMFGGCREVATQEQCDAYRRNAPAFERNNSYCTGFAGDGGSSGGGIDLLALAKEHNNSGVVLYKAGDYSGAILKFSFARAVDPSNIVYRQNWINATLAEARNYLRKGDCFVAENFIKSALNLDPSNEAVRVELAKAEACHKKQESQEAGTKLNEEGNRLFKLGDYANAIRKYQEALKLIPSDKQIRENLTNAQDREKEQNEVFAAGKAQLLNKGNQTGALGLKTTSTYGKDIGPQIKQLEATAKRLLAKVPPPLPQKEVSFAWTSSSEDEPAFAAIDGLVFIWDLAVTVGPMSVPYKYSQFVIAGAKTLLAAANYAEVYIAQNDELVTRASQYLKDPATAREFAELLRRMKEGRSVSDAKSEMLAAARAVVDSKSNSRILWDAMMSPGARAAMVRQAAIEVGAILVGKGTEGMISNLSWHREVFDAARIERASARNLLKYETRPVYRKQLYNIIEQNNKLLENLYTLKTDVAKSALYLQSIKLPDIAAWKYNTDDIEYTGNK